MTVIMIVTISSVPRSQLLITFSIAGVQLVATVVWCLVHLPGMLFLVPYLIFDWRISVYCQAPTHLSTLIKVN